MELVDIGFVDIGGGCCINCGACCGAGGTHSPCPVGTAGIDPVAMRCVVVAPGGIVPPLLAGLPGAVPSQLEAEGGPPAPGAEPGLVLIGASIETGA